MFEQVQEFLFVLVLLVVEKILKVVILEPDDQKALELISLFRGRYIIWTGDKSSQAPKELDCYDQLPSTVHVAVFLNRWLIAYGRMLFGSQQLLTNYHHLLNGFAEEIVAGETVEISRLLVIPKIHGFRIRGSIWSALVQLLIYRKFFKIGEQRGVSQWWAVLGPGLLRLLRGFNFPFERINDLQDKDDAGTIFAVKMEIEAARSRVKEKNPILYWWFTRGLRKKERPVRLNGKNSIPTSHSFGSKEEPTRAR